MALIRNAQLGAVIRDAIVLDMGDIDRQAAHVREAAGAEAHRILEEARAAAEKIRAEASKEAAKAGKAEGRAEGIKQGRAEGKKAAEAEHAARLKELDAAWTSALNEFVERREAMLDGARGDVVRLALAIAERVTRRAIAADARVAERTLEELLGLVTAPTRLMVAMHPEDAACAAAALPGAASALGAGAHAEIVPDASFERGSVVVRTGCGGVLDASVATQLERIARELVPGGDDAAGVGR